MNAATGDWKNVCFRERSPGCAVLNQSARSHSTLSNETVKRTMKTLLRSVSAVFLFAVLRAAGALVGPGGYTNSFSVLPAATDWSTLNIAGEGADMYSPDAYVNSSISASAIAA